MHDGREQLQAKDLDRLSDIVHVFIGIHPDSSQKRLHCSRDRYSDKSSLPWPGGVQMHLSNPMSLPH